MFTVYSKGLFAGAGGVYFQPQYNSDTLLALLSRTPKGEQRQLCLYKSWVIKGVFGSSTVQNEWSSNISIISSLASFHPSILYLMWQHQAHMNTAELAKKKIFSMYFVSTAVSDILAHISI